ncbi:MAG: phosphotransferase [Oscillibacter sp.]|nr:phosphotransferase [Oscillibacter sp.]
MDRKCELLPLAEKLSQIMDMGSIADVREKALSGHEQGFSGAELFRMELIYKDGKTGSFICKKADLKERMVMQTLTMQGHSCTPAAYSADCTSEEPAWMIQQDLGQKVDAPHNDSQWMGRVADALAEIHGSNMNRGEAMPWLPHADAAYWEKIVTQISVDHFEKAVCEDSQFARQFESLLPRLRETGKKFVRDMTALYQEAEWLTLTHGDLQNIDGDHVYNVNGKPYIIDFGFARYAPFYIDLVDYFSLENVALYHQSLTSRGYDLHWNDFEERFRSVYRYPGFIYMFPSIMQWKSGSEERLINMINRILKD